MELFGNILDFVTHLNDRLPAIMHAYGAATYVLLFLIVFLQTGFVVFPFLPGDALIFIVGALCVSSGFNVWISGAVFLAGAIAGDNVNYQIGKALGPRLAARKRARLIKPESLEKAHAFSERQGAKMMILSHFVAVVRTFAPFVAGVGRMTFKKFFWFGILGAALWVGSFLAAGYFLGVAFAEDIELLILGICVVTTIPAVVTFIREKKRSKPNRKLPVRAAAGEE